MLAAFHMALRSLFSRGVIADIDDTGGDQTVTLDTHYGVTRSSVPVHHPFGLAAHAPHDGAVTHVVANGSDPADLVALPPANPSVARMGNLAEGEVCLYDSMGQKLYFQGGKIVRVDCASELQVRIGGTTVFDVTQDRIYTPLDIQTDGKITAKGDVVAGTVSLQNHVHKGVQAGSGTSGTPQQ
ncbi:phage baseplate assembly protein [Asaia bogorensis]|uniref:phage baseplate assembly protein domain-containing protein n=1 Tax=Asaia bogorensis TaxID=91915 RepID=UPI000EFAD96E|nr:phage baseplate assembly protein [Asaia bogorensis]